MDYYKSHLSHSLAYLKFLLFFSLVFWGSALADVNIAPELSVSFPQPLKIGGEIFCTDDLFYCRDNLRYYLEGGYAGYPFTSSERSIQALSVEAGTRFFPWENVFYTRIGIGFRRISVASDISAFQIDGQSLATNANLTLNTLYFSPAIGLNFSLGAGFFLGMDFGLQIPIFASGNIKLVDKNTGATSDNSDVLKVTSDAAVGRIANLIVPAVTLFRFSYYFN